MRIHSIAILGATLLLAGCASKDMVVVLPAADGHIGGVVVEACNKKVVLDTAYAEEFSDCHAGTATADGVDKGFHDVLQARPIPPKIYDPLLFENDSPTELQKKSAAYLTEILGEFSKRVADKQAVEIVITGHADKTATSAYNLELSQKRADGIKSEIMKQGVPEFAIKTVARGQLDAEGPDGKPNEHDRNVVITVR